MTAKDCKQGLLQRPAKDDCRGFVRITAKGCNVCLHRSVNHDHVGLESDSYQVSPPPPYNVISCRCVFGGSGFPVSSLNSS